MRLKNKYTQMNVHYDNHKELRFERGGDSSMKEYNAYFYSTNPLHESKDGFGNNPPFNVFAKSYEEALKFIEKLMPEGAEIISLEEVVPMGDVKMAQGGVVANSILHQLGGAGKLVAMTGAYNFIDRGNGLSFKIKNAKANYIKITLNGKDLYDVEVGKVRGTTYKVVAQANDLYFDQLKPFIEEKTGMYLSLYAQGGRLLDWQKAKIGDSAIVKSENKIGVIVKDYGRKFHLRFPDGSDKTYDANELKFLFDEDEYAQGGAIDGMATVNELSKFSGVRPIAIAEWADKNNVNLYLVLKDIKAKKIKGIDLMTAIVGKVNNTYSKQIISKYSKMAEGGEVMGAKYPKNYKVNLKKGVNPKYNYALLQVNKDGKVMLMGTYTKLDAANSQKRFWEKNYAYPNEVEKFVVDELVENKMAEGGAIEGKDEELLKYVYPKVKELFHKNGLSLKDNYSFTDGSRKSYLPHFSYQRTGDKLDKVYVTYFGQAFEVIGEVKIEVEDNVEIEVEFQDWSINEKVKYAKGGVTFSDKVKAVKKTLLERKKVSPKVQKDYGKTYSPAEAEDSAKRIAGAMRAKERLKKKMTRKKR